MYTTTVSLMIERSECINRQREDWLLITSNPNAYLKDDKGHLSSLCLLCPLYSFVPLRSTSQFRFMYNSSLNIECSERVMAK